LNTLLTLVFIVMTILSGLGLGIWLNALTVRYRDFQYVLPFAMQLGIYVSPVAYPSSLVPSEYQFLYYLNPMAGAIDGMRWALFGSPINEGIYISLLSSLLLFISGWLYFHRLEGEIADIV